MKKETVMELLSMALENKSDVCSGEVNHGRKEFNEGINIVVLQRGWVVIGNLSKNGEYYTLNNAYVIRRWGTSEGLGELALKGKQSETVLEKTGTVKFHELTTVAILSCDEKVLSTL